MKPKPKMERYTIRDFDRQFPDEATCLEWLKNRLHPEGIYCKNCEQVTKHHRVKSRPSYSCDHCGHHVHPTAGTIFHKSCTPLTIWFHAIYLMASTRCGISVKQIQRETGVTYKTAWRMFKQIRSMLGSEKPSPIGGFNRKVEMDESYFGPKNVRGGKRGRPGPDSTTKVPVVGMVQRKGEVRAFVAADTRSRYAEGDLPKSISCLSLLSLPTITAPTTGSERADTHITESTTAKASMSWATFIRKLLMGSGCS